MPHRLTFTLIFVAVVSWMVAAETTLPPVPTRSAPQRPGQEGVDYFRGLLSLSPEERQAELAKKTEAQKQVFLKALREYDALTPNEREVRLQTLELRVHLYRIIRTQSTHRADALQKVPERIRPLVAKRMEDWNRLNPAIQKQVLDNRAALLYFTRGTPPKTVQVASAQSPLTTGIIGSLDKNLDQWSQLSASTRQSLAQQFQAFFELSDEERQSALKHLTDAERRNITQSLTLFKRLPAQQRSIIIQQFDRLAQLPETDRNKFLRNASLWGEMTPNERQSWRSLVDQFPPMPPDFPMPPALPKTSLRIELPPFPGN